ncbi:MAG: hypothetical protein IJL54_11490 [Prevotella sp.]|nr:hypothetical protein [Prevotella sp.]
MVKNAEKNTINTEKGEHMMVYMISHYIRNHRSPYKKPMVSCMVTIGSYAWERMRTMIGRWIVKKEIVIL